MALDDTARQLVRVTTLMADVLRGYGVMRKGINDILEGLERATGVPAASRAPDDASALLRLALQRLDESRDAFVPAQTKVTGLIRRIREGRHE